MDNEIYNLSPDDHVTDWIPAYALGILAADEATIVTQHLADCAACQAELDSYLAVLDVLPLAAAETEPATALKGRLLERVRGGEKTAVSPTSPPWWQPLANALQTLFAQPRWQPTLALVVLVALVAAAIVWRQSQPAPFAVTLTATDVAPAAHGELTASGDAATLTVAALPPLSPEQQYQLWLIKDGQRTSGAVFSVDEQGEAVVTVVAKRPLTSYDAFGITIEPAGGSPGPTGERVLGFNL